MILARNLLTSRKPMFSSLAIFESRSRTLAWLIRWRGYYTFDQSFLSTFGWIALSSPFIGH